MAQKVIVTHDGRFHADDVCAVATLRIFLNGEAVVARTRDREKIASADFVVDVGEEYDAARDRFDHHQKEGAGIRPDGIPYAAFGLVWRKFGEKIAGGREMAEAIDRILVQPLDAYDNGVSLFREPLQGIYPYAFSDVVQAFTPTWREDENEMNARFSEAVSFAQKILLREIEKAGARFESDGKVNEAYQDASDKRLIVFDVDYPWKEALARFSEPLFVAHPQGEVWYVECVRDDPNTFVNRKDFPEIWAGLRDAEFARVTGVPDAIFCHRSRFMAVTKSKEGAIQLAHIALGI